MAKRRKTRTHVPIAQGITAKDKPRSFVIKAGSNGHVGSSVSALVKDVRRVMEPNTATKLRERKSNRLRDYLAMCGPLGVTHMMVFTQPLSSTSMDEAETTVNMRICRVPRGPTLMFKVLRYSLASDILSASKRPKSPGQEFTTEPLLILNGFASDPNDRALSLMTTTFQNMFPSIQVHDIHLSSTRRVILISYDSTTRTLDWRHYLISVRPIGISKSIRKIISGSKGSSHCSNSGRRTIPNLSSARDVSDYILSNGVSYLTSDSENESDCAGVSSEVEGEGASGKVELPQHYVGRGNKKNETRAVRVTELGPRMELGLVKIEDGVAAGEVIFHEFIKKSKEEIDFLKLSANQRKKRRLARREEQDSNVAKKQAKRDIETSHRVEKRKSKQSDQQEEEEGDDESDLDDDEVERIVFGDQLVEDGLEMGDEVHRDSDGSNDVEDTTTQTSRTNKKVKRAKVSK